LWSDATAARHSQYSACTNTSTRTQTRVTHRGACVTS
jgi:hypothetical protein